MYKLKFKDCDCVYVGQTSRALKTRVIEQLFFFILVTEIDHSFHTVSCSTIQLQ